jgi:hypothetical protein
VARYTRRDLFKHFIHKDQRVNQPCHHACCRGYRPHPEHYPVVLPARYLRRASDEDLAKHYGRCPEGNPGCRDQVLDELHRRDVRQERRQAAEDRRSRRWADRRAERAGEVERIWLAAEAQTKGNMLNRRGREAGIDERSLFRGPESRVRKYGSEELLNFFDEMPRPTEAYFRGDDTRLGRAGMRSRLTSQEQQERDYYERLEHEERERAAA